MQTTAVVSGLVLDDRDQLLLQYLRSNAGRFYTVKHLCSRFGYDQRGNGSTLRRKLKDMLLIGGLPVVCCHLGVGYVMQANQVKRYREQEIEKRIKALTKVRDACIKVEQSINDMNTEVHYNGECERIC